MCLLRFQVNMLVSQPGPSTKGGTEQMGIGQWVYSTAIQTMRPCMGERESRRSSGVVDKWGEGEREGTFDHLMHTAHAPY